MHQQLSEWASAVNSRELKPVHSLGLEDRGGAAPSVGDPSLCSVGWRFLVAVGPALASGEPLVSWEVRSSCVFSLSCSQPLAHCGRLRWGLYNGNHRWWDLPGNQRLPQFSSGKWVTSLMLPSGDRCLLVSLGPVSGLETCYSPFVSLQGVNHRLRGSLTAVKTRAPQLGGKQSVAVWAPNDFFPVCFFFPQMKLCFLFFFSPFLF